jgi:hypothetical protein
MLGFKTAGINGTVRSSLTCTLMSLRMEWAGNVARTGHTRNGQIFVLELANSIDDQLRSHDNIKANLRLCVSESNQVAICRGGQSL